MSAYDENLARLEKVAIEKDLVLNPDEARVRKVVGLMTENFFAAGEYICPCKQQHKPPVAGQDKLCPCPEMATEIREQGHCFCRLFYTPEAARA